MWKDLKWKRRRDDRWSRQTSPTAALWPASVGRHVGRDTPTSSSAHEQRKTEAEKQEPWLEPPPPIFPQERREIILLNLVGNYDRVFCVGGAGRRPGNRADVCRTTDVGLCHCTQQSILPVSRRKEWPPRRQREWPRHSNNDEAKRCDVRSGSVVNVMNSNKNTQICEKQIGQPPQLTDYLGVTGWGCEVGRE